jgi:hypothetical protein
MCSSFFTELINDFTEDRLCKQKKNECFNCEVILYVTGKN